MGDMMLPNMSKYELEDVTNHYKLYSKWVLNKSKNLEDFLREPKLDITNLDNHKEKVVIWTGPAWEPWDKNKVDEGMAGSETWASYLAEEFVRKGYDTRVYNDLNVINKKQSVVEPVYNKDNKLEGAVVYRDHTNLKDDLKYDHVDYFISSRSVEPFNENVHASKRFVMIHDIWLSPNKDYDIKSWAIQKYGYLSDWHGDFLEKHHNIPREKMFLTSNGVDQRPYSDVDFENKKNQMIFSSSPDRGLYQLLLMVPEIRKICPDFNLYIAYGFFNWESAAKMRKDEASLSLISRIKGLIDQPGVKYLDRINKEDLATYQKESKYWFMPEWFSETFCCHEDNLIFTKRGYKKIVD